MVALKISLGFLFWSFLLGGAMLNSASICQQKPEQHSPSQLLANNAFSPTK